MKWFKRIQYPITVGVNKIIPQFCDFLYQQYGQITPQILIAKRDAVTVLSYNPSKPINQLRMQINDYSIMAQAIKTPATNDQIVEIGKILLQKLG